MILSFLLSLTWLHSAYMGCVPPFWSADLSRPIRWRVWQRSGLAARQQTQILATRKRFVWFFFSCVFVFFFFNLNRSSKMVYVRFKGMCFISALKSSWDSCQNSEIFIHFSFFFFFFFLIPWLQNQALFQIVVQHAVGSSDGSPNTILDYHGTGT